MANRVFNSDQIRLGGYLLTGSSQGLFFNNQQLAAGVLAAPISRTLLAGSGLLGFTNSQYTSNLTLNHDMEFHVTAGNGLTVGTDDIYIGAGQVSNAMLAGSIDVTKVATTTAGRSTSFGPNVSVILGGNDATPAFNLIDATGYLPIRFGLGSIPVDRIAAGVTDGQLLLDYIQTGEIDPQGGLEWDVANSDLSIKALGVTNNMLAGSIADGKLAADYIQTSEVDDSSIEFDNGNLNIKALGVSNAMLAGNIVNGKLVNHDVTIISRSGLVGDKTIVDLGETVTIDVLHDSTLDVDAASQKLGVKVGGLDDTYVTFKYAGSATKGGAADSVANALGGVGGGGIAITDSSNNIDVYDGSEANFVSVDATVVRTLGTQSIGGLKTFSENVVMDNNLTIDGDLQVRGATIQVTSNEVNIGDNIIVLNSDLTYAIAPEQGGIHIRRGSLGAVGTAMGSAASLVWDPVTGWMAGLEGSETKLHTLHDSRIFSKQMSQVDTARMDFGDALGLTAGDVVFDAVPNCVVSLENTYPGNNDLVAVLVTGIDTSGVEVVFSNTLPNQYYKLKAMVSAL